jgi:hypothetical protein
MVELISDKDVTTRKPHRCCICQRKFDTGAKMNTQTYVYDAIQTSYTCETCRELISNRFLPMDDEEAFMYTCESLEWGMENDQFKGTPEEYLAFKKSQKLAKTL